MSKNSMKTIHEQKSYYSKLKKSDKKYDYHFYEHNIFWLLINFFNLLYCDFFHDILYDFIYVFKYFFQPEL